MLSIWSRSFNKKTAVCGNVADFSEFMLLILRGSLSNSSTNVFNSHKVSLQMKLRMNREVYSKSKIMIDAPKSLSLHQKNGIQPKRAFQCLHYVVFLKIILIVAAKLEEQVTAPHLP